MGADRRLFLKDDAGRARRLQCTLDSHLRLALTHSVSDAEVSTCTFDSHAASGGIVLTLIGVCAAAGSGAAEVIAPRDVNAIDAASPFIVKANKEWEVAIQTGDADALSRPYHEDGVFVGPDGNAVRGRSAIRAMYAGRAAEGTNRCCNHSQ